MLKSENNAKTLPKGIFNTLRDTNPEEEIDHNVISSLFKELGGNAQNEASISFKKYMVDTDHSNTDF